MAEWSKATGTETSTLLFWWVGKVEASGAPWVRIPLYHSLSTGSLTVKHTSAKRH